MATTIISDITSRITPATLSSIGYDTKYDTYADIIENAIKDRGYNRILASVYTSTNIAAKTSNWFIRNKWNVTRLLDIPSYDYNPTHNYDGTESESISNGTHTDTTTIGERISTSSLGAKTTTDTLNKNAYNDSSLAVDTQDSLVEGAQTNTNDTEEAQDSITYGAQIVTRTLTKGGNLGVTTTEQMLNQEFDMLELRNVINSIVDMWLNDFTIGYYFDDSDDDE